MSDRDNLEDLEHEAREQDERVEEIEQQAARHLERLQQLEQVVQQLERSGNELESQGLQHARDAVARTRQETERQLDENRRERDRMLKENQEMTEKVRKGHEGRRTALDKMALVQLQAPPEIRGEINAAVDALSRDMNRFGQVDAELAMARNRLEGMNF